MSDTPADDAAAEAATDRAGPPHTAESAAAYRRQVRTATQRPPSSMAPFRHPAFRMLWIATLASNLGGLVQTVGSGWMMTSLTSSHDMVALVQASNTLPIMVLALASGALADNYDRRIVMLTAQCFMCCVSALLALAAFFGLLQPWSLLCFTFLIGCGTALNNPSWQSSMGDLVPREDLPAAISLNAMGFNMMRSVGPAIGGLIVAAAGPAAAFGLNAVSYVTVIGGLLRWHPAVEKRTLPRESLGMAMGAGLRYVAMSPNLVTILFRAFCFGLSAIAILALLPVVARDMLHGGALTYGLLFGAYGIGAIGGALCSPWARARYDVETIIRGSFIAFALGATGLGLSGSDLRSPTRPIALTGAAWVLGAVAVQCVGSAVDAALGRRPGAGAVPDRQLRRHVAGRLDLGLGLGPTGGGHWRWCCRASPWPLARRSGLRWRLPEFSSLNLDPLDRFSAPSPALDLRARSGPVMVTVEYRIAQDDVDRFLELMSTRRRIRIRDGARHWVLLRDMEDPETLDRKLPRPDLASNTSATTSAGPSPTPPTATC